VIRGVRRRTLRDQRSTAVIWMKCFEETGRCAAQPRAGALAAGAHADFCWVIAEQPDLTLTRWFLRCASEGFVQSHRGCGVSSRRHRISLKKASRGEQERADVRARRRWMREQACLTRPGWCSSTRPPPIPNGEAKRRCARGERLVVVCRTATGRRSLVGALRRNGMTAPLSLMAP